MRYLTLIGLTYTGIIATILLLKQSKQDKKIMAKLADFQAVAARIEAASQKIIDNQGITADQEDELLATLTAQAEELEAAAGDEAPVEDEE